MIKENKNNLLSFLYLLCLYLACNLIPYNKITNIAWVQILIKCGFFFIVSTLCFLEYKKSNIIKLTGKLKFYFVFPLFIGCCSNFIYIIFCKDASLSVFEYKTFLLNVIKVFLSVYIEEMLFRVFCLSLFLNLFNDKNEIISILLSSFLFSIMHCINFYGNDYINVLIQLGYTFILGLILSIIKLSFKHSFYLVFIGHFLFNTINMELFTSLYLINYDALYFIISIIISILCLCYSIFIYKLLHIGDRHAS